MSGFQAFVYKHRPACSIIAICLVLAAVVLGVFWLVDPTGNYEPVTVILLALAGLIGIPTLRDTVHYSPKAQSGAGGAGAATGSQSAGGTQATGAPAASIHIPWWNNATRRHVGLFLAALFLLAAGWGTSFFGGNSIREYMLGVVYFPAWGTVALGGTLLFATALTSSIFGPSVRKDRDSLDTAIVLGFIGVLVLLFPILGNLLSGEYAGKTLAEIFARVVGDIAKTDYIRAKEFGEGFVALPEGWQIRRWHVFAAVIPLTAFAIAKWKWRIACWLVLFPLSVLWPQL